MKWFGNLKRIPTSAVTPGKGLKDKLEALATQKTNTNMDKEINDVLNKDGLGMDGHQDFEVDMGGNNKITFSPLNLLAENHCFNSAKLFLNKLGQNDSEKKNLILKKDNNKQSALDYVIEYLSSHGPTAQYSSAQAFLSKCESLVNVKNELQGDLKLKYENYKAGGSLSYSASSSSSSPAASPALSSSSSSQLVSSTSSSSSSSAGVSIASSSIASSSIAPLAVHVPAAQAAHIVEHLPVVEKYAVELDNYPTKFFTTPADTSEFTLGDLHGNSLKFLHLLIASKLVTNIDAKDYKTFKEIYYKGANITINDLIKVKEILAKMQCDKDHLLRLIGDEFSDRGQNDILTILIFNELEKKGLNYEILVSNHGEEIIESHAIGRYDQPLHVDIPQTYCRSRINMAALIENKIIDQKNVDEFIENTYVKHLKLLSYNLSASGHITIYSHAPIDLNAIKILADSEDFKIDYNESDLDSGEGLARIINGINAKFKDLINNKEFIEKFRHARKSGGGYMGEGPPTLDNILVYLSWNRDHTYLKRDHDHVTFVHGHDQTPPKPGDKVINMDNNSGKRDHDFISKIECLVQRKSLSPALQAANNSRISAASSSSQPSHAPAPVLPGGMPKVQAPIHLQTGQAITAGANLNNPSANTTTKKTNP